MYLIIRVIITLGLLLGSIGLESPSVFADELETTEVEKTIATSSQEPEMTIGAQPGEEILPNVVSGRAVEIHEALPINPPSVDTPLADAPTESELPIQPPIITKIQNCVDDTTTPENEFDEFVELYNPNTESLVLDASWSLVSVNDQGKVPNILYSFNGERIGPGGFFVIKHAKSPQIAVDGIFKTNISTGTLNKSGSVKLLRAEVPVDVVGWGAAVIAEATPALIAPSLQRCVTNAGIVIDSGDNSVDFLVYDTIVPRQLPLCALPPVPATVNTCNGLKLNEVGVNVATEKQFIELYNASEVSLQLKGCRLKTNRSTVNEFVLSDESLAAGSYKIVEIPNSGLIVTKTTTGTIYLLDEANTEIDSVEYDGLPTDTSYSLIDNIWQVSYAITPSAVNQLRQYPPCDEGYYRNEATGRCNKEFIVTATVQSCDFDEYRSPETGRCRKIVVDAAKVSCKEGQYRSEETGRCRSILATVAGSLKPCEEGQFRNPETGRCKKIASVDDMVQPCHEGYERNPTTNRCRKVAVLASSIPEVPFAVQSVRDSAKAFTAWWALGGIGTLALAYGVWEWRDEARRGMTKITHYLISRAK